MSKFGHIYNHNERSQKLIFTISERNSLLRECLKNLPLEIIEKIMIFDI